MMRCETRGGKMKAVFPHLLSIMKFLACAFLIIVSVVVAERVRSKIASGGRRREDHNMPESLHQIVPIDTKLKFTLTSMAVEHRSDARWHIPHYHDKNSPGWNRTVTLNSMGRPLACNIRFFATGLESTLKDFTSGGTGYLTVEFSIGQRKFYNGFTTNEADKLHCYYMSNKGFGSEFIDKPKTLSLAVYCPVSLDAEIGEYDFQATMKAGNYCRALADYETRVSLHLRPSSFRVPLDYRKTKFSVSGEIESDALTSPAAARMMNITDLGEEDSKSGQSHHVERPHAVCTVQTFRNGQTGPMLYLFVSYYHRLGWKVIVYDRFGFHREFLEDLINLPGFDYHPYTLFQIVNPSKYTSEYAQNQGFGYKIYYSMEKNWGYGKSTNGTLTDTADQDADKVRTYDHSRVEYAHLDTIMYVDSDELFYCPQAPSSLKAQRKYQQKLFNGYTAQGIEEMRVIRLPYAGFAPPDFNNTDPASKSLTDFTMHTAACMQESFVRKNVSGMLGCWSDASAYDDFPKSADIGGVCPFHYNHWSCDGMKGGGRDHAKANRCRCKVAFDLINHKSYRPEPDKCHLLHFNNNKYRFQLRRNMADSDKANAKRARQGLPPQQFGPRMSYGEVTDHCPMHRMFAQALL